MKRNGLLASIALCATSFLGSLVFIGSRGIPQEQAAFVDVKPVMASQPAAARSASPLDPAAPVEDAFARHEPTVDEVQASVPLREQATAAEEGEERGDAIRRLARFPGAETVRALIQSLQQDADVRNRLIAIESLRTCAERFGDADWVIRNALGIAAHAPDEVVAAQARGAYQEISARLGTRR